MSSEDAFADLGDIDLNTFRPARGRILVQREPAPEKEGMIYLPSKSANDQRFETTFGRVIKLGHEEVTESGKHVAWSVSEGDKVIISKFAGHDVRINGDDSYNIMTEQDIMAVVPDTAE